MGLPLLTYNGKTITFPQTVYRLQVDTPNLTTAHTSAAGLTETLNVRADVVVETAFRYFYNTQNRALRRQLEQWAVWASEGRPWNFALDSSDLVYTSVTAAIPAGVSSIQVANPTGIVAGGQYVIRSHTHLERVEVASIAGSTLTLAEALNFGYLVGARFRSVHVWPGKFLDRNWPVIDKEPIWFDVELRFAEDVNDLPYSGAEPGPGPGPEPEPEPSLPGNVEIPFEMLGKAVNSNNAGGGDVTFLRSATYLDPTEFDGVVGHYWEVTVQNNHASSTLPVQLVNEAGGVVAAHAVAPLSLPSNNAVRMRTAFTPVAGPQQYRLKIPATPSSGNLIVYTSRLITVLSEDSTKCVVQIPLCEWGLTPTALDTATTEAVDRATATTYGNESPDRHTWWRRDDSKLGAITGGRLEAVCRNPSSDGTLSFDVALLNLTDGDTPVVVLPVGTPAALSEYRKGEFTAAAANFLDAKEYRVKLKTGNPGFAYLFKCALYLKLDPINHLEVWHRFMALNSATVGNATVSLYRVLPGMEGATGAALEATGRQNGASVASSLLMNDGVNESGLGPGAVAVTGASLTFPSTTLSRVRTADLLAGLVNGNRYIGRYEVTSGALVCQSSFLVVTFK